MATLPPEVKERVVGYIKHQAAKEPAALRSVVEQGHEQLTAQLKGVSDEQVSWRPSPDEWSLMDLLRHVADAKRGVARICERLAAGEQPGASGPEGEERRQLGQLGREYASLAEVRAAIEEAHAQLLAFVDGLSPAANVEATHEHEFFGMLTCREWAAFQRVHDGDHAQQIEKITSTPGFPA